MQGLEAQLLREVVAQERGELEEAKERLLLGLAADTRQLHDLQDRILKLLKVSYIALSCTKMRSLTHMLLPFALLYADGTVGEELQPCRSPQDLLPGAVMFGGTKFPAFIHAFAMCHMNRSDAGMILCKF